MRAYWLLEQLQQLHENFDTYDALDLIRRCRSSSSAAVPERPITLKKMSGKLNRLCCMRFLARTKVKRVAFTRNGHQCFRGHKYLYRITTQGHSYIRYRSARAKLGYSGSNGSATFDNRSNPPPARSGIEDLTSFLMISSVLGASQTIDQLKRALEEERAKNHHLHTSASQDAVILSAFIASARNEVMTRNKLIQILRDTLIRTANLLDDPFPAEFRQSVEELAEIANTLPDWMK